MTTPNSQQSAILAREYGYLDAKHGMDYAPRPTGHEKEYQQGYESFRRIVSEPTLPGTSYADKGNWGWY